MNKMTLIGICVLFAKFLSAQDEPPKQNRTIIGLNTGVFASSGSYGFKYCPQLYINKGKHLLALGPGLDYQQYYPEPDRLRLNTLNFSYQINPNPRAKRFNFFFEYDLIYHRSKSRYYSTYRYYKSFENYVGYGFNVSFLKRFYLNQSVGIGSNTFKISYDKNFSDNACNTRLGLILKLGIGCRFYGN